jgi:hypothetical protein
LKLIAGSAGATVFPILTQAAQVPSHAAHMQAQSAATGPYVLKHFTPQQAKAIDALSEILIPSDNHSPGAKAARVFEYIDDIVSSAPESARKLWADGIAALDGMARSAHGQEFARCDTTQQTAIMEKISRNEEQPGTLEQKFFGVLKGATIDGYYTSKIGIHQELEYQGNTAMAEFPGCTHDEHKTG